METKEVIGLGVFSVLICIIAFIFVCGYIVGYEDGHYQSDYTTSKVQEQFFEIEDYKKEIAVCEYNAGVEKTVILTSYIPMR